MEILAYSIVITVYTLCLTAIITSYVQFKPTLDGLILMKNVEHPEYFRVEKRRLFFHISLITFMVLYSKHILNGEPCLFLISIVMVNLFLATFAILKFNRKDFHKNIFNLDLPDFNKKSNTLKRNQEFQFEERSNYLDLKFDLVLFNKIKRYDLLIKENMDLQDFKNEILKKENPIFKFKNKHEALYFHNLYFDREIFPQKEFCIIYKKKESTFKGEPNQSTFSINFNDFISN